MAELSVFSYRPESSIFHGLDARFKILFLFMISLASLGAGFPALLICSGAVLLFLPILGLTPRMVFTELRFFFFMLLIVFSARALATPGNTLFAYKAITVTAQGLIDGVRVCLRLLLIVLLGLVLTATTRSAEIRAAVAWILKPFSTAFASRVATMMGLILRFIPEIFNQVAEITEAQRARCIENRKNPVLRLIKLGPPLIRRTFEEADRLIIAMESRCYSEERTGPVLQAAYRDWIALGIILPLSLFMFFI